MIFEDVLANETYVEHIAEIVRTQPRSLILEGDSGCGKTTLARIAQKAILCQDRRPSGSPCGTCSNCHEVSLGRHPCSHELNCASHGSRTDISELIDGKMGEVGLYGRYQVALLEEAKGLSPAAMDALLQPMEEQFPTKIFLLTLLDATVLSKPLRDRCRVIKLNRPNMEEALAYLDRICTAEHLDVELDALRLIASVDLHFRALAENLEKLASISPSRRITVDHVRETLLRDRSTLLLDYLRAVLANDEDGQFVALGQCSLAPLEKVNSIRNILIYLRVKFLQPPITTAIDPSLDLMLRNDHCQAVMELFEAKASALKLTCRGLFDQVLEHWAQLPREIDESILKIIILRFSDLINCASGPTILAAPGRSTSQGCMVPSAVSAATWRYAPRWRRSMRKGPATADAAYLTIGQVRELYEAATFMPQRYGTTFNAVVQIFHPEEARTTELVGGFTRDLDARIQGWLARQNGDPAANRLQYISLHERGEPEGLVSTIIFHVPQHLESRVTHWITDKFARREKLDRTQLEISVQHSVKPSARLKHHWKLVRMLWRGADPEILADGIPLLERLKIRPEDARPAGVIATRRFNMSQSIGQKGQDTARASNMPHLSAFADERWDWLFGGWELTEYRDRCAELERRGHQSRLLLEEINAARDPLSVTSARARLDIEKRSWETGAWQRPRSWIGWWVNP